MFTKRILMIFLFSLFCSAEITVGVSIYKKGFKLSIGKTIKKKRALSIEKFEKVETVKLFHTNSQDKFLFSKGLSNSLSSIFGKAPNLSITETEMTKINNRDNLKRSVFVKTINIENTDDNSLENLTIKLILESETELHIFLGELEYNSVFILASDLSGNTFASLGNDNFSLAEYYRSMFHLNAGAQPACTLENGDLIKTGLFYWTSKRSGLMVMAIKPENAGSFRIKFVPNLSIILYKKNPTFSMEYQSNLNEEKGKFRFTVISQEPVISQFECPLLEEVSIITTSRNNVEKVLSMTQVKQNEKFVMTESDMRTIITKWKARESASGKKMIIEPYFDFSVLMSRMGKRIDFQFNTFVNNRYVYFNWEQENDKLRLKVKTLNKNLNEVEKIFEFDKMTWYKKVKLAVLIPVNKGCQILDLELSRSVRIGSPLFSEQEFCMSLSGDELVQKDHILISDKSSVIDFGYFEKLLDEKGHLKDWETFAYALPEEETLKIFFYNKKRGGIAELKDEEIEINYMSSLSYLKKGSARLVKIATLPLHVIPTKLEIGEDFKLKVYEAMNGMNEVVFKRLVESNPRFYYVNYNRFTLGLLKSNLKSRITKLSKTEATIIIYPTDNYVEVVLSETEMQFFDKSQYFIVQVNSEETKNSKKFLSTYSQKGECLILKTFNLWETIDEPLKLTFLIFKGSKKVVLEKTQIAYRESDNSWVVNFKNYNVDYWSEYQLSNLYIDESQRRCEVPPERTLRFTLSHDELTLFNSDRQKRFVSVVTTIKRLYKFNFFQFRDQPENKFQCVENVQAGALDEKRCVLLAGGIIDLSSNLEMEFFGKFINFFSQPVLVFKQQKNRIKLDFLMDQKLLDVVVGPDSLIITGDSDFEFSAQMSPIRARIVDPLKRYFTVILHLFINEIEEISSKIYYEVESGISQDDFAMEKGQFLFKVAANGHPIFLEGLQKVLNRSRLIFAAESFEDSNEVLNLVVYEQNVFACGWIIDGMLINEGIDFVNIKSKIKKVENNEKRLQEFIKQGRLEKKIMDKNEGENKVIFKNEKLDSVVENKVCTGEQCYPAAIFQFAKQNTQMILTKKPAMNSILKSGQTLVVENDENWNEVYEGLPIFEIKEKIEILI